MEEIIENLVRVTIYGQEYTIKAKAEPAYITSVANYVNEKMEDVEKAVPTVQSSIRVAILAAMNITDELFSANKDKEEILKTIDDKSMFLIDIIDEKLKK
ncbi:MAG: cell division protein ZapA [Candidatus Marinimicrobia bacterium CG08_land_8_20_14_0_20_45_22]|nr:MAG: cell division protein ZapA [Candidatus Marinimicrobia bacterium CG08_land_8_20_14_0_20_45_22]